MLDAVSRLGLAQKIISVRSAIDGGTVSPGKRRSVELASRRLSALRARFMGKPMSQADGMLASSAEALKNELSLMEAAGDPAERARLRGYIEAAVDLMRRIESDMRAIGASTEDDSELRDIASRVSSVAGDDSDALVDQFTSAGAVSAEVIERAKSASELAFRTYSRNAKDLLEEALPEIAKKLDGLKAATAQAFREVRMVQAEVQAMNSSLRDSGPDDLREAMANAKDKLDSLWEAYHLSGEAHREAVNEANQALDEVRKSAAKPCAEIGQALISGVLSASPITEDQAGKWADSQEISKTAVARLKKMGYPIENVRRDMAEFYRFTGGRVPFVSVQSQGDRRANATEIHSIGKTAVINLGSSFDKRVLWHELAHHIEADPVALQASMRLIRRRAVSPEPKSLRSLTGNRGYDSNETAFEDHFFDEYVGKKYDSATEVFSMGVESFSDPEMMGMRFGKDPETIMFVAGFLKTPLPASGQALTQLREVILESNKAATADAEQSAEQIVSRLAAGVAFERSDDMSWATQSRMSWAITSMKAVQIGFLGDDRKFVLLSRKVYPLQGRRKVSGLTVMFSAGEGGFGEISIPIKDINYARAAVALYEKNGVWPRPGTLFNESLLSQSVGTP